MEAPGAVTQDEIRPLTEPLAFYEDRSRAHPNDRAALVDLLRAYEREGRWGYAAAVAWRLTQYAPDNADYQHRRALNLMRVLQATHDRVRVGEMQEPLDKCIELDPKFADCHFLLGEVALWSDDEELAEERYRRAIELDPRRAAYYQRLAELYAAYRQDRAAAAVLSEALRFAPVNGEHAQARFPLLILLADLTAKGDDPPSALRYLEQAEPLATAGPAPLAYELAAAYANTDPPRNSQVQEKVVTFMKRFYEAACRGDSAVNYREQCLRASLWVMGYAQ